MDKIAIYLSRAGILVAEIEQTRNLSDDATRLAEREREALLTRTPDPGGRPGKLWPVGQVLRVKFLDGSAQQRAEVEKFARDWEAHANIRFEFGSDDPDAEVRISFNSQDGSWSFVGTDALGVASDEPTMNLGWVFRQNVVHEFGHVLGLVHEHQNPVDGPTWNRERVIADMTGAPNFWNEAMIEETIFRKLTPEQYPGVRGYDPTSIMGYAYSPGWLADGSISLPGETLSQSDKTYIAELYPRP